MKALILAILIVAISAEMVVTPEYTEYLKKTVDWEVADYEENIFKGWSVEDVQGFLGEKDQDYVPEGMQAFTPTTLPSSINWEGANCIHEIRNQGNCGSCWAFATASVASDKCCLGVQDYGWLSTQELVSCDKKDSGCNGGLAAYGFEYVRDNGLVLDSCYPYIARAETCPTKCKTGADWKAAHVCKCQTIVDCGTETGMKSCLQEGPIAVRLVVYRDFMSYKSGVYCWNGSGSSMGGHAIRCVGYSDSPKPNLKCANSWGISWGVQGYFQISTGERCGLRMNASQAWSVKDC